MGRLKRQKKTVCLVIKITALQPLRFLQSILVLFNGSLLKSTFALNLRGNLDLLGRSDLLAGLAKHQNHQK